MAALTNLGMRIQETISESTRDLPFMGRSPNLEFFDTDEDKVKKISRQLESSSERDKLEAMKRLVALISKGRNVSEFFAQVVKNVGSNSLETRKLVYIYLLRYAGVEPDLALLSINTFQKDLADPNPLIRAMALRVLSGIPVPIISSLVVLGIGKCASDTSPYVRKTAALAIPKAYGLDAAQFSSLMTILSSLLHDRSPLAIGAVAVAFNALCSTRLDLLHPHYRRLCRMLGDLDEWGQIQVVALLTRYGRRMFSAPTVSECETPALLDCNCSLQKEGDLDADLGLLLNSVHPLLQSRNPAVAMAAIRSYFYLSPASAHSKVILPLISLLHRPYGIRHAALSSCLNIASTCPDLLRKHITEFFVKIDEPSGVKRLKVRILVSLANAENTNELIAEFKDYARDTDDSLVSDSIRAIGHCAKISPSANDSASAAFMNFLESPQENMVTSSILMLKSLYQFTPSSSISASSKVIARLASRLDTVTHGSARAALIWLVGQYSASSSGVTVIPGVVDWAPDVLRKVAKSFAAEPEAVRLQCLTLAAKLLALSPSNSTLVLLARYVFSQARYDVSYDIRDRARMLAAILRGLDLHEDEVLEDENEGDIWERKDEDAGGVKLRIEQARVVLFEGKVHDPPSHFFQEIESMRFYTLGTMGIVANKSLYGSEDAQLPDWTAQGVDSHLRDSPVRYFLIILLGVSQFFRAGIPVAPDLFGSLNLGSFREQLSALYWLIAVVIACR
ncbi:adaptin N terminal region-domain-containing protein [Cantharellus anzutake]|uniref:adaptin N terminal region-domain-containing protein n=1 Tax=Cantharellus anzutake TaxID=1750568 RepID=UPI0019040AEB|nr:adaptin N terminal region-domain-containing protein [Cantharellus anzutake]KAF8340022.1 adaptin N terminal region-domain-containing protein [Cantharellus anzutake]